jgi:hypothetical protein
MTDRDNLQPEQRVYLLNWLNSTYAEVVVDRASGDSASVRLMDTADAPFEVSTASLVVYPSSVPRSFVRDPQRVVLA